MVYWYSRDRHGKFAFHDSVRTAVDDIFMRLTIMRGVPKMGIYAFREQWEDETGLELDLTDQ